MLLNKQQHNDYSSQTMNTLSTFKVMTWIKAQLKKYYQKPHGYKQNIDPDYT